MPGARSYRTTTQALPNGAWTTIIATAARWNDEAMWAAATPSRVTATASGLHIVTANITASTNGTGARLLRIQRNAAAPYQAMSADAPGADIELNFSASALVNAASGDYFEGAIYHNAGVALATGSAGSPTSADLTITRLPSGLLAAKRESSVAQSIPNGVATALTFDTTVFDSAPTSVSGTNALVAPADGTYAIFAGAYMPAAAGVVCYQLLAIQVAGVDVAQSIPGTSAASYQAWSLATTWPMIAGTVVQALVYQASGAARLLDVAELRPYLAMVRIGP